MRGFLLVLLVGCNSIFGIDEARLDPSGAGDAGIDPNVVSCKNFCGLMAKNCTGTNKEYSDDKCESLCAAWETGDLARTSENTLGCRQAFAIKAATDPNGNCEKAGPLSAGGCVEQACESFCFLNKAFCNGKDGGFLDDNTCKTDCNGLPYDPNVPMAADQNRRTLNCRVYHLEFAASGAVGSSTRDIHCGHTGGDAQCKAP